MKTSGAILALGYSGVWDYCHRGLSLSEAQAYYFKSVADASIKVPKLKEAVQNGELSLSLARRIAPVITEENQTHWIDLAKSLPQKELEREVQTSNPNATKPKEKIKPIDRELSHLSVLVTQNTETDLKNLQDLLSQKLGRAVSLGDVIEWAVKTTKEKYSPVEKAKRSEKRISMRSKVTQESSLGRTPIPSSVKHEVVKREAYQCNFKSPEGVRCQTKRWLNLHHQQEVSKGGKNTSDNLTFLCTSHHKFIHKMPRTWGMQMGRQR
jgi:5-methylcytosine-specific restriction endonuclease McrA